MKANPFISAIIITKNEERNIGRCLESLKNLVDEIVIVDSFSTDNTKNICTSYEEVKFISSEWKGYAETKNYANSLARGKFIFSVDADESVSEALKKSILNFISEAEQADACSFNRLTNFCGKWIRHGGWYPDTKIRMWKKGTAHWEGIVHEKIVLDNSASIIHLDGNLLHYSYYSIDEFQKQIRKYSDLSARENYHKKKKSSILKIFLSPLAKFFTSYFLRAGFLDGYYGLVISLLSSRANFLKYSKTYQLFRHNQ